MALSLSLYLGLYRGHDYVCPEIQRDTEGGSRYRSWLTKGASPGVTLLRVSGKKKCYFWTVARVTQAVTRAGTD